MKIITAMGNPYLNNKLNEINGCEIIGKDIQYEEGIIEILEEIKDVDMLVMTNTLPEEYNFFILINKIKKLNKKLEIVVFLDKKDENIENFLTSKKIYKVYYLDEVSYMSFLNSFRKEKLNENNISEEINNLKSFILSNSELEDIKEDDEDIERSYFYEEYEEKNNCKTIVISGNFGTGKSMISCLLAQSISYQQKKTLLIDFDLYNSSIYTILGLQSERKDNKVQSNIYKINSNLDVLKEINRDFSFENETECYWLKNFINKYKKIYDFIIIDTSSNINLKYVKTVLTMGDRIVFLVEPNLSEVKKGRNLIELFVNDLEIDADKIKLVFNKTSKYQIAESILEEIFSDFEVIGNIKYDDRYSLFINKNFSNVENNIDIEKLYEKIK